MCLQYLCDIVVDDFIYWLEGKGKSRCLLARLLWPDEARDGMLVGFKKIKLMSFFFRGCYLTS